MRLALLFTVLLFIVLLTNCKKNSSQGNQLGLSQQYDTLSSTDDSILTALPDTTISLGNIVLDDGENVLSFLQANDPNFLQTYQSETALSPINNRPAPKIVDGGSGTTTVSGSVDPLVQRRLFLSRMTAIGNYLKYRPNWKIAAGTTSPTGITSPAQYGLAYSYGSRDLIRQVPPKGQCQTASIYGLDCSGMIYQMITSSSLAVVPKASISVVSLFNVDKWNAAFQNTPDYDSLIMVDEGNQTQIPYNQIQFGDLVFWVGPTCHHMAMCIGGWIYECGGTDTYPGCTHNLDSNKGPKCIPLSGALQINQGNYEIFRVVATSASNSNNSRSCVFTFTYPQIQMVLGISLTFVEYTGGESNYMPIYNTFPVCKNGNWGNAKTGLGSSSQIPFTIGYNGSFDTLSAWDSIGSLIGFSFTQPAGGQSSYRISCTYVDSCADTNVKSFYISQLFKCP